jgi:hypothetical protein
MWFNVTGGVRRTSKKGVFWTKRKRFVLVSVVLSLVLFALQATTRSIRIYSVIGFGLLSYSLSAWALLKGLNDIEWLTNLILTVLFPVSVFLFYFLLPQSFITRVLVTVMFGVLMYSLLLTANIFSVASIRTIQLLRAARAVGFLLTVLTAAFLYHLVLSFKPPFYLVFPIIFVISFVLFLQGFWTSELEDKLSSRALLYTFLASLILAEFGLVTSFLPVDLAMASLLLSMLMYVILGLFQHLLRGRLFKKTRREYIWFGLIVLLIVSFSVFLKLRN